MSYKCFQFFVSLALLAMFNCNENLRFFSNKKDTNHFIVMRKSEENETNSLIIFDQNNKTISLNSNQTNNISEYNKTEGNLINLILLGNNTQTQKEINNKTETLSLQEVKKVEQNKENTTEVDSKTNNNSKDYANYDPNLSKIISSSNEDEIAKNWIYIFTVCIFISLIVFIYNVIKCYNKNQIVQRPNDTKTYSKELQNLSATDDDPVIDLSN